MIQSSFDEKGYGNFCESLVRAWYDETLRPGETLGEFDRLSPAHKAEVLAPIRAAVAQLVMEGYSIDRRDWFQSRDKVERVHERRATKDSRKRKGGYGKTSWKALYRVARSWILFL